MNNVYLWLGPTVAGLLALVAILYYIWRGVRTGEGPHCRACGYPAPESTSADVLCSECGANLRSAKSLVTWSRRPVSVWWKLGAGVVTLAVVIGAVGTSAAAKRVWNSTNPPTWVLKHKAMIGPRPSRLAAANLLSWRMDPSLKDAVTDGQLRPLVKWALEEQTSPTGKWADELAQIVIHASEYRRLARVDEERYLRACLIPRVVSRHTIAHGARLPILREVMWRGGPRMSRMDAAGVVASARYPVGEIVFESLTIGGVEQPLSARDRASHIGARWSLNETTEIRSKIPTGVHDAVLVYRYVAREVTKINADGDPIEFGLTLVDTREKLEWKLNVKPVGEPILAPILSEQAQAAVTKCINVASISTMSRASGEGSGFDGIMIQLKLWPLTHPIAARIVLRERLPLGTDRKPREYDTKLLFARPAGSKLWANLGSSSVNLPSEITACDVILVPDESAADGSAEMTEYLGEEIVIENVPVNSGPHP